MALKFLNKKGWHTGSLRNIENVWKAEQKHDAEQKKLEELRKQIGEERERSEFRQLQEQAGLVPRQERLEFLYDSGLAVGKGSASSSGGAGGGGSGFKALEESLPTSKPAPDGSSNKSSPAAPGALFEDKPQSANDSWRKLHSDPLLMIRQREQEALARIKNNPVQMALIRKSAQEKKVSKSKDKSRDKKKSRKKDRTKHSSKEEQSDSEVDAYKGERRRNNGDHKSFQRDRHRNISDSENESVGREDRVDRHSKENHHRQSSKDDHRSDSKVVEYYQRERRNNNGDYKRSQRDRYRTRSDSENESTEREHRNDRHSKDSRGDGVKNDIDKGDYRRSNESHYNNKRKGVAPKLSEEERAARLREMQEDAEVHEEQRWKRLKKAEENDAQEASRANNLPNGKNFLEAAHQSVYGAEKGGSSTIEESVRRRTHYLQGRNESEGNAFRRR